MLSAELISSGIFASYPYNAARLYTLASGVIIVILCLSKFLNV